MVESRPGSGALSKQCRANPVPGGVRQQKFIFEPIFGRKILVMTGGDF
jgi:hypothetical protein